MAEELHRIGAVLCSEGGGLIVIAPADVSSRVAEIIAAYAAPAAHAA